MKLIEIYKKTGPESAKIWPNSSQLAVIIMNIFYWVLTFHASPKYTISNLNFLANTHFVVMVYI
jgi:hypothetical protein